MKAEPLNQTDVIDQACACEQFFTDLALQAIKGFELNLDNPDCTCLNCGEHSINRFCDTECRDEYQEFTKKSNRIDSYSGY